MFTIICTNRWFLPYPMYCFTCRDRLQFCIKTKNKKTKNKNEKKTKKPKNTTKNKKYKNEHFTLNIIIYQIISLYMKVYFANIYVHVMFRYAFLHNF